MEQRRLTYEEFAPLLRGRGGQVKVACPLCIEKRSNKADKSLSIHTQTLAYNCHYCGAKGVLKTDDENFQGMKGILNEIKKKEYVRPNRKVEVKDDMYPDSFLQYFKERGISKETLKKCKVTKESEYIPKEGKKVACIAFNYFLGEELINIKFRSRNKGFASVQDAEPIPYNINSIHPSAYKEGEEKIAFFVEGEFDALTYVECGYNHVVSCPSGASGNHDYINDYIDEYFEHLDYIYISSDNDANGKKMRDTLLHRFGKESCRVVSYPAPCKDINEVLVTYGKEAVKNCVESAVEIRPEGIMEVGDVESQLDHLFYHGYTSGVTVGDPELDKLVSFKPGLLTIVTGVPAHGKTYALNYILTKLNIKHDWRVAFFSPEFYPVHEHIGQIMETLGGKRFNSGNYNEMEYQAMKEYVHSNFFWIDPDDTELESVIARAKYLIKRRGIKALVIDPFNALTDKKRGNQKKDEYISDFLQELRHFARAHGIAVFLVMHPTKLSKLENGLYPVCDLYNCKGASEVNDKADIGITVWRNKDMDYCEIHIVKIKFRHLGKLGFSTFKFNINNGRYVEIPSAEELDMTGKDIRVIDVPWDNSNYIVNKIEGGQTQQEMELITPSDEFSSNDFSTDFDRYDDTFTSFDSASPF